MSKRKKKAKANINTTHFEDSGMKAIEKPSIFIPRYLNDLMHEINDSKDVDERDEFSILSQSKIKGFSIEVLPVYFIPKQRVSGGEILYDESRPDLKWNTVIHRHPDGMNQFSGGDNTTDSRGIAGINMSYDISLLWTAKEGFVFAQYNMYSNRTRLFVPCNFFLLRPDIEVIGIEKIKKQIYQATKQYDIYEDSEYYSSYDTNYNWYKDKHWNAPQSRWRSAGRLAGSPPSSSAVTLLEKEDEKPTMIVGNNGGLVKLSSVENSDNPSIADEWMVDAEEFFGKGEPIIEEIATATTMSLDNYEANYQETQPMLAHEFFLLSRIMAHVACYWEWKEEHYLAILEYNARDWAGGYENAVRTRVKRYYEYALNHELNTTTSNGNSANSK